ncbi:DUF2799 domain-containing protein [Luteimonas sp. MJ250]|uniref:DUF2799 domain-containing protein n=1 Tax=Luteimonas sp. MJ250 TaxID=3129236 RepID=UPI0031B9B1FC
MRGIGCVAMCVLLVLLAGCATMSRDQCMAGNWERAGYQDGAAGHAPSRLADHEAACMAHGISVDARLYLAARERGLEEYCTPYRGFEAGSNGRSYAGVCPAWAEADFLAGYADGRVVHDARQYVERARSEISTQEHRIRQLRKDTDRTRERIGRDGISAEDRKELERELRRLRDDTRRAEDELGHAHRRHGLAERELDQVMRRLPSMYGGGGW